MPDPPVGREVAITWRGRRARAFVPALLADRPLPLAADTVARAAAAAAELGFGAAALGDDAPALARLLLRTEGVASSSIEGIAAEPVDVVLTATAPEDEPGAATAVVANMHAIAAAAGHSEDPLTTDRLRAWHAVLMTGALPADAVGAFRDAQGWIGGTSPLDAALVTPPPEYLAALLDDLVAYANRDDVDPVVQAAVAHAQFELVHPFADGNGRIGRLLIAWILVRRLALVTPPPVSLRVAADRDGYLAGLAWFRLGDHERWIRWFAEIVTGAGRAQVALARAVEELRDAWRARLGTARDGRPPRRDALAWRVLDLFPRHLVVTAAVAAAELDRSARTASDALDELVRAGILSEHIRRIPGAPGRPSRYFVAPELLALASSARLV